MLWTRDIWSIGRLITLIYIYALRSQQADLRLNRALTEPFLSWFIWNWNCLSVGLPELQNSFGPIEVQNIKKYGAKHNNMLNAQWIVHLLHFPQNQMHITIIIQAFTQHAAQIWLIISIINSYNTILPQLTHATQFPWKHDMQYYQSINQPIYMQLLKIRSITHLNHLSILDERSHLTVLEFTSP